MTGGGILEGVWVFGYGSLIWRPGMAFAERRVARVRGWARRFWQGSHDHRGLPHAPGRVVTLVPEPGAACEGVAYRLHADQAAATFAGLDHREKNGYQRCDVRLEFRLGGTGAGVVYVAPEPGGRPFVSVGDEISEGDTLFIVEAMKTMNPVRAPSGGRVTRILAENGARVEYGEVLLILE